MKNTSSVASLLIVFLYACWTSLRNHQTLSALSIKEICRRVLLHKPSYACLSHCWGTSRSKHITKHENFETNCEGIPISELPRIFREAVLISRALHLQYIWIDSICIVQDDEEDWTSHVKLMANIYSNAYITLAAGANSDDSGGFFREAPPEFSNPHSFQILDGHGVHKIFMRRHLRHPDGHWPLGRRLPLMEWG